MGYVNLETAAQVVAIAGGVVAMVAAGRRAAETWIDIGEKLKKRRGTKKSVERHGPSKATS